MLQTWIERERVFLSAQKLNKPENQIRQHVDKRASHLMARSSVAAGDKKVEREKFFDLIFTIIASHSCIHSHRLTKCFARQFR